MIPRTELQKQYYQDLLVTNQITGNCVYKIVDGKISSIRDECISNGLTPTHPPKKRKLNDGREQSLPDQH